MAKKASPAKLSDETEKVDAYMARLKHPLKAEIETVRSIIKGSNKKIMERIKWNAPSFFCGEDMVTFHVRPVDHIHLVFHHPEIVSLKSKLLEGDYKDRRMVYFQDAADIRAKKKELETIMKALVKKTATKGNQNGK